MSARDELQKVIFGYFGPTLKINAYRSPEQQDRALADAILSAGYRRVFDGDCGLSNVKDPTEREAAEAWMRWANLVNADGGEPNGIAAMKQMLTEFGYRKPRTITTPKELDALPFESVIRDSGGCVLERWGGPRENSWASPAISAFVPRADIGLPATVIYEPSA